MTYFSNYKQGKQGKVGKVGTQSNFFYYKGKVGKVEACSYFLLAKQSRQSKAKLRLIFPTINKAKKAK